MYLPDKFLKQGTSVDPDLATRLRLLPLTCWI